MDDFDKALAAYLKQPDIQKRVKTHMFRIGGTGGGSGEQQVREYAKAAVRAIIASLPSSLRAGSAHPITASDLIIGPIRVNQDGNYEVELNWNSPAVHRESLYQKKYPDGIDDIVALFSTGYHAHASVWGQWAGHQTSSSDASKSKAGRPSSWTLSRKYRKPDLFLQVAVAAFNDAHANEHVKLILGKQYVS